MTFWKVMAALLLGFLYGGMLARAAEAPLFLSGEADLALCKSWAGGRGTVDDPYILRDLSISAAKSDYGIWIENTTSWIVIEKCAVTDVAGSLAQGGIVLRNCRNIIVRGCTLRGNRVGVALERCSDVRIENNDFIDNGCGLDLGVLARDNIIIGNTFNNVRNAVATAPNTWSESGYGNCWSDLRRETYEVSPGNVDWHPHSLAACPAVPDTTPPVIRAAGSDTLAVEVGSLSEVLLLAVTATDNCDGAVAVTTVGGGIDLLTVGEYAVTYRACDEANNCAELTRQVAVVDRTPPTIDLLGETPLKVGLGSDLEMLDPGAHAVDQYDGSVPVPRPDYAAVNVERIGTYSLEYCACDRSGNCAQLNRPVLVIDQAPPNIEVLGDDPFDLEAGRRVEQVDPGARAIDSYDGSLHVVVDYSRVDESALGRYEIAYQACDQSGNCARATRWVSVVDHTAPVVEILGADPLFVEAGTTQLLSIDPGARAVDGYEGEIGAVSDIESVDTSRLGEHLVMYRACDRSGNCGQAVRRVVVVDRAAPEVILLGANPLVVEVESDLSAVDPGARASDRHDGPLSVEVDYREVNTRALGAYRAVYRACDASGNCAGAARDIRVVDTQAPQLVLTGPDPLILEVGQSIRDLDPGASAADAFEGDLTGRIVADYSAVLADSPGTYEVKYMVRDSSGNTAENRRTIIAGLGDSPVIPADAPFEVAVHRWSVESREVVLEASILGGETESAYLDHLNIARLLRAVACSLPGGLDLAFRYHFATPRGTTYTGVIPASDAQTCSDWRTVVRIAATISGQSGMGEMTALFLGPPRDAEDVRMRVRAVFDYLMGSGHRVAVEVVPYLIGADYAYRVSVSSYALYRLTGSSEDCELARRIHDDSRILADWIAEALHSNLHVAVSAYVDVYGLVYSGETAGSGDTLEWVDRYVHPLLGAP